jgi:hypothetical protein
VSYIWFSSILKYENNACNSDLFIHVQALKNIGAILRAAGADFKNGEHYILTFQVLLMSFWTFGHKFIVLLQLKLIDDAIS